MADNVAVTAGSGTTIATDDVGGVQHQRVKVEFGADGSATDVSAAAPLPSNLYGISDGGFVPEPAARESDALYGEVIPIRVSAGGELISRSTVSTDEGHFRHDFPGSALTTAITGTSVTLTNGSAAMTGVGTSFTTQLQRGMYVKLGADAESAWVQVESIESDTAATLAANYSGTGGTGAASFSYWYINTGSGGSFSVSSSIATIASGNTATSRTNLWRPLDYPPMRTSFIGVSVSQRIANQVGYVGLRNIETSPTQFAEFQFDGTTNTTVKCATSNDGATIKTTTVTIPYVGGTTTTNTSATAAAYEIEAQRERVTFLIGGQIVATHDTHIPGPYDVMGAFVGWVNGTTPASSTNMTLDDIFVRNTSFVQVQADFTGNPIPVELRPGSDLLVQAQPIAMTATNNIVVAQLNGRASQLMVELSGTFTGTVTFEALFADQGVWTAHNVYVVGTTSVTTATAVGRWMVPCAGLRAFRVRSSTAGTGTVNVSMQIAVSGNTVVQLGTSTAAIGAVTVTSTTALTPGTAAANLGKAEDAVAATGDTGVAVWGVLRTTGPGTLNNASATGDYTELPVSSQNGLWVAPAPIQVRLTQTPTVSTTPAYASGDQVGGLQTFTGAALATGRGGQIVGATLIDKGKQKAALELWVFIVSPTLAGSDNNAFDLTDANLVTAIPAGVIAFPAARYVDSASSSVCFGESLSGGPILVPFVTSATANLFGVLVSRGTPTYASTTDLVVDLVINQF